MGPWKYQFINY